MRDRLKVKGMALALAAALALGAPAACVLQTPVEVSAKAVKKGLKQEGGRYYFYDKGKKVKNKWQVVKKKRYYFKSNGAAAIGWNKIGKKAYYFTDKGVMVKNKKVDQVKLNKKGEASLTTRAKMLIEVQSVLDKRTKPTQSKAQKLKACYNYVKDKCGYGIRQSPAGNPSKWEAAYAYDMLKNKKGNCYSFAAGFAMLARGCGYKATVIVGQMQKPIQGDTLRPHAWVEIGGKVYDPQTQQVLKNYKKNVDLFGKAYGSTGGVKYALSSAPNVLR